MAAALALARPSATVTFDYKTGRTSRGLPLEHIKAGTLAGLVAYLAHYSTRAGRPELCATAEAARLGLDEDFVAIFWTMFPGFARTEQVVAELSKLAARAAAAHDIVLAVSLADALATGIDPSNRFLLYLPPRQQAELVASAERVVHMLSAAATAAAGRGSSSSLIAGALEAEAIASLATKVLAARLAADIASTAGATAHLLPSNVLAILANSLADPATAAGPGAGGAGGGGGGRATLSGSAALAPRADSRHSAVGSAAALSPRASAGLGSGVASGSSLSIGGVPMAHRPSLASTASGAAMSAVATTPASSHTTPAPALGSVDLHTWYSAVWAVPYETLAAQWTYIEHSLFRVIPVSELLGCGWDKPRYEHAADALRRYVDHFNAMALWVTAEVMAPDTNEERAAMIVRFIKVGVHLRRFNNFSALVQLCLGLRRDIVVRLSDVWHLVPTAATERLQALYAITDDRKNYRAYKEALKMLPPTAPVVPHLGAHTAELTMQDQLLPEEVTGEGGVQLIHFRRHRELYKLFTPIFAMQELSYAGHLPPQVPSVIAMLNATVRPFYFAFEEDRDTALRRLQEVSLAIQAPPPEEESPPPPPPDGGGDGGEGGDESGGGGGGGGEPGGGEAGGGEAGGAADGTLKRAARSFLSAVRMLSPSRHRVPSGSPRGSEAGEGSEGDLGADGASVEAGGGA